MLQRWCQLVIIIFAIIISKSIKIVATALRILSKLKFSSAISSPALSKYSFLA